MNKIRVGPYHVVFFIFIVSNVGGALTPIGDPPLFLGYLRGVPFFWLVGHVLGPWVVTLAAVLGVFYFHDRRSFARLPEKLRRSAAAEPETWRFEGSVNLVLLLAVVGAVFLPANYFLREGVMLAAAVASWFLSPPRVHEENAFTFAPIQEVAFLFAGIFTTMMPALGYLEQHGADLGFTSPRHYYFASGALSAVLDNAPTYLNFFELARVTDAGASDVSGLHPPGSVGHLLTSSPRLVVAISLGSVFFGALTYIGNGPNFMVKAIAHGAGVHCPTFFGYLVRYSLPILLPILVGVGLIFL
jgi:Na+/H+ antiporter NhaD/arsenite permease-like protein